MNDDPATRTLDQVLGDWLRHGPLTILLGLIRLVWRTDLARHDPELGDDAQTLGIQASRNVCNLAVDRLSGIPGVGVRDRRTLEVTFGGRVLHVGKAPDVADWNVMSVDWSSSEVRDDAARVNSAAYHPSQGTLFDLGPRPEGPSDRPTALPHVHLIWQGFPDGEVRAWLGFPRLGEPPWFAVRALEAWDSDGAVRGLRHPAA